MTLFTSAIANETVIMSSDGSVKGGHGTAGWSLAIQTGAAPRWISSLVIAPVWIASDQTAVPWPPLTEPSEDIIAVSLAMAVVKRTA